MFNPLLTWCDGWLTLCGGGVWVEAQLRQQSGVSAAATVVIPLTLLGATAVVRIPLGVHWITGVYPATANRCHRTLRRLFSKTGGDVSAGSSAKPDTYESQPVRCDWNVVWIPFLHVGSSKAWHHWCSSAPSQHSRREKKGVVSGWWAVGNNNKKKGMSMHATASLNGESGAGRTKIWDWLEWSSTILTK